MSDEPGAILQIMNDSEVSGLTAQQQFRARVVIDKDGLVLRDRVGTALRAATDKELREAEHIYL
jgi:hypothetical protein